MLTKFVIEVVSLSMVGTVVLPSIAVFAEENSSTQNEYVTDEEQNEKIAEQVRDFELFASERGIPDVKKISSAEQEKIINQYLDVLSMRREPISAILGAIAAAIAIGRGLII